MKTYEIKSDVKTSWTAIHERALQSPKPIQSGPWKSAVHRHPGECRGISAAMGMRKAATAAKIAGMRESAARYLAIA